MFADFQHYADLVKPSLDAAFELTLAELLQGGAAVGFCGSVAPLTGGKKIRGILLCLVTETLGGELAAALPRGVAIEMIQTASLIHDDFVDQHRVRRHQPALWSLEGARRAVLLGDVIFASAIRMMSELGARDCRIVSGAIAEVASGAYQEPLDPASLLVELESGRVAPHLYRKLIYLKTAMLFGAACELGGVAAAAGGEVQQLWRRYGLKIGEAYQIADDLQEVELALHRGAVGGEELTSLVPPLLFFAETLLPHLVRGVRAGELKVAGEIEDSFRGAALRMTEERERCLHDAETVVARGLPGGVLADLVLRTPRELLHLFDAASRPAFVP